MSLALLAPLPLHDLQVSSMVKGISISRPRIVSMKSTFTRIIASLPLLGPLLALCVRRPPPKNWAARPPRERPGERPRIREHRVLGARSKSRAGARHGEAGNGDALRRLRASPSRGTRGCRRRRGPRRRRGTPRSGRRGRARGAAGSRARRRAAVAAARSGRRHGGRRGAP